ncbi:Crp/Fnr family transcriptional regulator [Nonlabens tegetincola]|uniref:Crp/Fnr family transcriptional regulator n=1 Tax=Nonlabens tegetincola TaxID=323273 RepID=UPI000A271A2E|nr:Crp/Fnr family transcriptional regulator [Nonlabens tegetincola]
MMLTEKEQLSKYLNRYAYIAQEEVDIMFRLMEIRKTKKSEYLLEAGNTCRYQYFILNGLTRTFYIDSNGNEKITQFAMENWWVTNWHSYKSETPSESYIQALENTTVLQIRKSDLEHVFEEIPSLERAFRKITENWLIAIQRRSEFYLKLDSKSRYEKFISALPDFAQRVPQYMIASYLEITPQHLSTIRAKLVY